MRRGYEEKVCVVPVFIILLVVCLATSGWGGKDKESGYEISFTIDGIRFDDIALLENRLLMDGFEFAKHRTNGQDDREWRLIMLPPGGVFPNGGVYTLLTRKAKGIWIEVYIYIQDPEERSASRAVIVKVGNIHHGLRSPETKEEIDSLGKTVYQVLSELAGKANVKVKHRETTGRAGGLLW